MIDLDKTQHHRVYRTEVLGDTMVVTLQGDAAGFSISAVHNEMVTLISLAKEPVVKHLVIDMSGSNYYGSLILGEIMNLGQAVREKGGRIALAGMSSDMREVLRMMHLDTLWETFPTKSAALRSVAKIPVSVKVRPYWKPFGISVGIAALIALYVFLPRPDYTPYYYHEMAQIWDEAAKMKSVGASETEWQIFAGKSKVKLKELSKQLDRIASSKYPARQNILYVMRDHAPMAIDQRLNPTNKDTLRSVYHMAVAKAYMAKTDLPQVPKELGGTGDPAPSAGAMKTASP